MYGALGQVLPRTLFDPCRASIRESACNIYLSSLSVDSKHRNDEAMKRSGILAHWWKCLVGNRLTKRRQHLPPLTIIGKHQNTHAGKMKWMFPNQSRTRDVKQSEV